MSDYTKLVKALRYCMTKEDGITICEPCPYYGKGIECENVLHTDAAAAIEDLQAQLPKRGKWVKWADKHGMSQIIRIICSNCGKDIMMSKENIPNYCPRCGAKMEVQDG